MKKNDIALFQTLSKTRDFIKSIQQLSWNITQFDKKFSLEKATPNTYSELLQAYLNFVSDIVTLGNRANQLLEDTPVNRSVNKKNDNKVDLH